MRILLFITIACLFSCKTKRWNIYNSDSWCQEEIPPQMAVVDGGIIEVKRADGKKITDTLRPFCISVYEETNAQYRAYLKYLRRLNLEKEYQAALPDTAVWLKENLDAWEKEMLVKDYFRHRQFDDYPVVGVNAKQAGQYAKWKTDRMNEMVLIREGLLVIDTLNTDTAAMFETDAYLGGKFESKVNKLPSFDGSKPERNVRMEDALFLPRLRLPGSEEWQAAARAIGDEKNKYPKPRFKAKWGKLYQINLFNYFVIRKKNWMKSGTQKMLSLKYNLEPVYAVHRNKNGLHGMEQNVSELCVSGNTALLMGGSWHSPEKSYAADFRKDSAVKYKFTNEIRMQTQDLSYRSAALGFRLASDLLCDYKSQKYPPSQAYLHYFKREKR